MSKLDKQLTLSLRRRLPWRSASDRQILFRPSRLRSLTKYNWVLASLKRALFSLDIITTLVKDRTIKLPLEMVFGKVYSSCVYCLVPGRFREQSRDTNEICSIEDGLKASSRQREQDWWNDLVYGLCLRHLSSARRPFYLHWQYSYIVWEYIVQGPCKDTMQTTLQPFYIKCDSFQYHSNRRSNAFNIGNLSFILLKLKLDTHCLLGTGISFSRTRDSIHDVICEAWGLLQGLAKQEEETRQQNLLWSFILRATVWSGFLYWRYRE